MSIFKKIPNPFGKKGGVEHQKVVEEVAEDIDSRDLFPDFEKRVDLKNGKKRFIDVAAVDENKNIVELHQVGKQTKKGLPVKRERDAIEDVENVTGIEVEFHPYNEIENEK